MYFEAFKASDLVSVDEGSLIRMETIFENLEDDFEIVEIIFETFKVIVTHPEAINERLLKDKLKLSRNIF